jgi:hypothetical protein
MEDSLVINIDSKFPQRIPVKIILVILGLVKYLYHDQSR